MKISSHVVINAVDMTESFSHGLFNGYQTIEYLLKISLARINNLTTKLF